MDRARLATLLDPRADEDQRLEIADELRSTAADFSISPAWAHDQEVLDALTQLASDEDEGLLHAEAAETLPLLWVHQGRVEADRFSRLSPTAQDEVQAYFEANGLDLRHGP